MKKKTITVFTERLDLSGGRTVMLFKMIELFVDAGFDVTVCAFWQPKPIWWPRFKTVFPLPKGVKYTYIFRPTRKDRKPFKSVHAAESNSKDRLEQFGKYFQTLTTDAIYIPNFGHFIETAVLKNTPDHIYKILGDHHSERYCYVDELADFSEMQPPHKYFYDWAKDFDALHLVNPAIEDRLKEQIGNILSIPNFIDDQPLPQNSFLQSRTIVAGGRLVPIKKFSDMIKAFHGSVVDHPDWKLEIHGKGPESPILNALIESLGLKGSVSILEPSTAFKTRLAKAALHLSCSEMESYGLTLVEAMSYGVPVLSQFNHVGCKYLMEDGRGQIAATPNVASMTELLRTTMQAIEDGDTNGSLRKQTEKAYEFSKKVSYGNALQVWRDALNSGIASKAR